jgi:hypothetical protein
MADDPSPHGLAALAISVSLVDALRKQGLIDQATVEAILKEARMYAQALCIDCSPEVERETQRIVRLIRMPEEQAKVAEPSTVAVTDRR